MGSCAKTWSVGEDFYLPDLQSPDLQPWLAWCTHCCHDPLYLHICLTELCLRGKESMAMISKTTSCLSPIFKSAWGVGHWNSKRFQEMFKETYFQHPNMTGAEKLWVLCGDSITLSTIYGDFTSIFPHTLQVQLYAVHREFPVHREII